MNPLVKEKLSSYPKAAGSRLMQLRALILDVAATTEGVGKLEETLKWGEPAYLTSETGSGTTIRIDWKSKKPDQIAMYFNCRTNLVSIYRSLFPDDFRFEGNRAIVLGLGQSLPENELRHCVSMALRYHIDKAR
ncbi:MAG: DUF1801 domain-containing protein [bacterium]